MNEKEGQLKELIEAQKLEVNKQKTDQIAVANKQNEIKKAEKGNVHKKCNGKLNINNICI